MRLHTNGQRIRIRIRLHNAMREETNKRGEDDDEHHKY